MKMDWISPGDEPCSFSTTIYPSIFTFLLLSLHCWSTTTHPTDTTSHVWCITFVGPHTSHSIRLALLIWWTDDLQFTCYISFLSYLPLLWPGQSWIITPCSQPCAHFLDYHSYLTHLYLPFKQEYKFSPVWSLLCVHLALPHFVSFLLELCIYSSHCTIYLCTSTFGHYYITHSFILHRSSHFVSSSTTKLRCEFLLLYSLYSQLISIIGIYSRYSTC